MVNKAAGKGWLKNKSNKKQSNKKHINQQKTGTWNNAMPNANILCNNEMERAIGNEVDACLEDLKLESSMRKHKDELGPKRQHKFNDAREIMFGYAAGIACFPIYFFSVSQFSVSH